MPPRYARSGCRGDAYRITGSGPAGRFYPIDHGHTEGDVIMLGKFFLVFLLVVNAGLVHAQESQQRKIAFQSIAWTPDGKSIVFTAIQVKPDWSDYSADKWGLFDYDLDKKKLSKVTSSVLYFSLSPDGRKLAYDKSVDKNVDIYVLDRKTLKSKKLIGGEGKERAPSWSGDGKSLVFYSDRDGHEELYSYAVKTKKVKRLTNRPEHKSYNPIWAPKSDLIVYYLEKGDRKDQIYLTDSKGSFQTNLTADDHHNIFPSWTPDGRIIYARDKGEIMVMNSDGSDKRRLVDQTGGLASMSPDGKLLLFTSGAGDLLTVNLENDERTVIVSGKEIYP
ncbi:MAG: DUF5050 domain-containing protein [Acidobacteriota bacterium]|nr:DUF5050 domain-containing protein [Acidobacteriota bacterium]